MYLRFIGRIKIIRNNRGHDYMDVDDRVMQEQVPGQRFFVFT
jgi:hypothetical protein